MKVRAIYHHRVEDDGREVHSVEHDGGGFVVSSMQVGVSVQNFLHFATLSDVKTLHDYLLGEYAQRYAEIVGENNVIDLTIRRPEVEHEAMRKRGFADGENAAGWMIDPVQQDDPFMFISRIVTGMEEGDPEIMDSLPMPRLGGEWADDPTWEQICMEEVDHYAHDGEQELLAVYEEAFHDGVETQIRKLYNDLSPSRKVEDDA